MKTTKDAPGGPGGTGSGGSGGAGLGGLFDSPFPIDMLEPQVPGTSKMTDPATASAYAKERFQIFTIRGIAFNKKVVKGKVALADSILPEDLNDFTFTLKDGSNNVVYTNSIGMYADEEFELPMLESDGTYSLEVAQAGYVTSTTSVVVSGGAADVGTITLSPVPVPSERQANHKRRPSLRPAPNHRRAIR